MWKDIVFCHLREICPKNTGKKLLDAATKARLGTLKTASKKAVYQTPNATGEFIGNKIADKIVKAKSVPDENSRNVEEIVI